MAALDIFCNRGVKNLVANSLFCSNGDIVGLDEALKPRVCINFYSRRAYHIHDRFQIPLKVVISEDFRCWDLEKVFRILEVSVQHSCSIIQSERHNKHILQRHNAQDWWGKSTLHQANKHFYKMNSSWSCEGCLLRTFKRERKCVLKNCLLQG